MTHNTQSAERGFTLIELMVVVTIIGLLASAILVAIGDTRARARDARRTSDIRNVMTALELYNNREGEYPTCGTSPCDLVPEISNQLDLDKPPVDPRGDDYYQYQFDSTSIDAGGTEDGYAISIKYEKALEDETAGAANTVCRVGVNRGNLLDTQSEIGDGFGATDTIYSGVDCP